MDEPVIGFVTHVANMSGYAESSRSGKEHRYIYMFYPYGKESFARIRCEVRYGYTQTTPDFIRPNRIIPGHNNVESVHPVGIS